MAGGGSISSPSGEGDGVTPRHDTLVHSGGKGDSQQERVKAAELRRGRSSQPITEQRGKASRERIWPQRCWALCNEKKRAGSKASRRPTGSQELIQKKVQRPSSMFTLVRAQYRSKPLLTMSSRKEGLLELSPKSLLRERENQFFHEASPVESSL